MHKCGDLNMKLNDLICNSHSFFLMHYCLFYFFLRNVIYMSYNNRAIKSSIVLFYIYVLCFKNILYLFYKFMHAQRDC